MENRNQLIVVMYVSSNLLCVELNEMLMEICFRDLAMGEKG